VTKPVNLANFLAVLDELLDDMDTHFGSGWMGIGS
jgi:hypothetical protein